MGSFNNYVMQWWHPLAWEKLWQDYASVETGVAGEAKDYA